MHDQIGLMLGKGVETGILDSLGGISRAANQMVPALSGGYGSGGLSTGSGQGGTTIIHNHYIATVHVAGDVTTERRLTSNIASATDPGVVKGADGEPTGELNSPSAMGLATTVYGAIYGLLGKPETIQALGKFATNCGCTMVTDMANLSFTSPDVLKLWHDTVNADAFPVRVGLYPEPTLPGSPATPDTVSDLFLQLRETAETDIWKRTRSMSIQPPSRILPFGARSSVARNILRPGPRLPRFQPLGWTDGGSGVCGRFRLLDGGRGIGPYHGGL